MSNAYVLSGNDFLELTEQPYEDEAILQKLIAEHPEVLAGEQMGAGEPRRWLLVRREMPVPAQEGGPAQWSLDHLFLDQDAVPTLVEVKRGSNRQVRREVVGQMLDYAANGPVYWPHGTLQEHFERQCRSSNTDPGERLRAHLGADTEQSFWDTAETNLREGKLRLVFVADKVPMELRSIVEFLNRQMKADVLAVEVRRFMGPDRRETLVPVVIGQTVQTQTSKADGPRLQWNWDRFAKVLEEAVGEDLCSVAHELLQFGEDVTGRDVEWGSGKLSGSFTARLLTNSSRFSLFSVYTQGEFSVNFGWARDRLEALGAGLLETWRQSTNDRLGIQISERSWVQGWPNAPLSKLQGDGMGRFQSLVRDFVDEVRRREANRG